MRAAAKQSPELLLYWGGWGGWAWSYVCEAPPPRPRVLKDSGPRGVTGRTILGLTRAAKYFLTLNSEAVGLTSI